jgi:hypothetical protein
MRRWLGLKKLAMAILYSETAEPSKQMRDAMNKLNPSERKSRTKMPNRRK